MGSINDAVSYEVRNGIAVITVDNPPVNALGYAVRSGIFEGIARARGDASAAAVVIACAGRTFCAGADIREFGQTPRQPYLTEVCNAIEASEKPVVAALFGTVLGGGLEIALGCHHRVAAPGTKLGLPEVKLGLLPGAGGTQRLPRLLGPEMALEVIVSGNPIDARAALEGGLVDVIAKDDVTITAIAEAQRLAAAGAPPRKTRDLTEKLDAVRANSAGFDKAADARLKRAKGEDAPKACIGAVKASLSLPLDEGLQLERREFIRLVGGDQSRARRHLFFAEREAAKISGIPDSTKARDVKSAAVIGAGTMGGGIAMCFANAGIPVALIETTDEALQRGLGAIRKNYEISAARGGLSPEALAVRLALITGSTDLSASASADIIIEAVFEDMGIKKKLFADLDAIAKPGAVLATNTSYLDVNEIARATMRPGDVVGMHFFSPANVMRLLEVVRGAATEPDALRTAMTLGRRIGKVAAVVGVCDGFVGNRMLTQRTAQVERLLLSGALPQQLDKALTDFGFAMGPCAVSDLAGLDIGWRRRQSLGLRAAIADSLVEAGRLGQKSGKGYYRYDQGGRTPVPDPEAEAIIAAASNSAGVTRRSYSDEAVVEWLIYPMINEAARILEEGIASRASDIDIIWNYGYGWPGWRGGPMFFADLTGLGKISARLSAMAAESGNERLQPAPLLQRLAAANGAFCAPQKAA